VELAICYTHNLSVEAFALLGATARNLCKEVAKFMPLPAGAAQLKHASYHSEFAVWPLNTGVETLPF
jgi:hypothetical protein